MRQTDFVRVSRPSFDFESVVTLWKPDSAWHFATVPEEASDEIAARMEGFTRGFGSVKVEATIGGSTFATSLFPDSESGCYVLPLKKSVRVAEGIVAGGTTRVHLELVDPRP